MHNHQKEIPRARVNITLDVEQNGMKRKKELPLKLLALGDFSNGSNPLPFHLRERLSINKNNFNDVMASIAPQLSCTIPNTLHKQQTDLAINLNFHSLEDFHPDQLIKKIPALKKLLAMRNLLRDLKANLLDNQTLRRELERIFQNTNQFNELRNQLDELQQCDKEIKDDINL